MINCESLLEEPDVGKPQVRFCEECEGVIPPFTRLILGIVVVNKMREKPVSVSEEKISL